MRLYYHAYLDDFFLWTQLLMENFKAMEDSGMMSQVEKIRITAITQEDDRARIFHEFCSIYRVPMEIEFMKNQYPNDREMIADTSDLHTNRMKNVDERHTLRKLHEDCQKEDLTVLYFHAKGITSIVNNLIVPGRVSKYRNRYYWRMFVNKTISEWKTCVDALNTYDVAGVDYKTDPSEHFCGNFFWSTSDHIRKLPNPTEIAWWNELKRRKNHPWLNQVCDRFAAEMWICSRPGAKYFNLVSNNGDYIANDI